MTLAPCEARPQTWPALRRLSADELANTVRDLLGLDDSPRLDLPQDDQREGFRNDAALLQASPAFVNSFERTAFALAELAVGQRSRLLGCAPGKETPACVRTFVGDFGRRAFRRPLSDAELEQFAGFFERQMATIDGNAALQLTVAAFLQSPEFLYRDEGGSTLDAHQLAARLSYALWQSMPDEVLFQAAENQTLLDPKTLREQAGRLAKDPRMRDGLAAFHRQWLSLDRVDTSTKDTQLFPAWTPDLAAEAREESERFAAQVLFDRNGSFRDLMTSPTALVTAGLAKLYGVESDGSTWQQVELAADERAGILTRLAFQASRAHAQNASPILRGITVLERVVCETVPTAPNNVNTSNPADEDSSGKTNRQLFEARTAPPLCQGCHAVIDPYGYAFEAYDAVGRFRREEQGQVIDVSGTFGSSASEGRYDGPIEFVGKLADSSQAHRCYGGHWYQFLAGRPLVEADACREDGLGKAISGGASVLDLLGAIVNSPEFLLPGGTVE